MPNDTVSEPPSSAPLAAARPSVKVPSAYDKTSLMQLAVRWFRQHVTGRQEASLKEVLEDVLQEQSSELGEISAEEKNLLKNMIHFGELTVHDIMVPRADIMAIERDISFEELHRHVVEIGHTRIPVYEDSLDKISGFIHVKDLFPAMRAGAERFDIHALLRKILFVPPSMRVVDLLLKMRVSGCHMAIVVDEYGGVSGLITIEDVLEEIVGEIEDEYDMDEEANITTYDNRHFSIKALTPIEEFNDYFNLKWSDEEFDTVAGILVTKLGHLPKKGERISFDGLHFKVLQADSRRIKILELEFPEEYVVKSKPEP